MKILILIFCLVLLFRNTKEPFYGKLTKGVTNVAQSINNNVIQPINQHVAQPIYQHVIQPINNFFETSQREKEAAERQAAEREAERQAAIRLKAIKFAEEQRIRKLQEECSIKKIELTNLLNELSGWNEKISKYENNPTYFDTNFNKEIFSYYKTDLDILNNIINENNELNKELNGVLTEIEILQTDSKLKIDKLNSENIKLKECEMNKELTVHDFEILK